MDYNETIKFLYNQLPVYQNSGNKALNLGLDKIQKLLIEFNNPEKFLKIIHIGGTNGKGSSAHSIAAICQYNNLKTGLYTSPHLFDFRERIRVNGKKVDKSFIKEFINKKLEKIKKISPSFFEITFAMSLYYFKKNKVDLAIIEVGLGGRLDSTNVVNPLISLITNIGFDHKEILGSSLNKIANEKAGIIKENSIVIIGKRQKEIENVFINKSKKLNSKIYFADKEVQIVNKKNKVINFSLTFNKKLYSINSTILSNYYLENIPGVILTSYFILKSFKIKNKEPFKGIEYIKETGLRGRWEILSEKPKVICDICHNIDAFNEIIAELNKMNFKKVYFIVGGVNSKDWENIIKILPKNYYYLLCQPNIERKMNVSLLSKIFRYHNLNHKNFKSTSLAFNYINSIAKKNDLIFVGGSLFVVSEFFQEWERKN